MLIENMSFKIGSKTMSFDQIYDLIDEHEFDDDPIIDGLNAKQIARLACDQIGIPDSEDPFTGIWDAGEYRDYDVADRSDDLLKERKIYSYALDYSNDCFDDTNPYHHLQTVKDWQKFRAWLPIRHHLGSSELRMLDRMANAPQWLG